MHVLQNTRLNSCAPVQASGAAAWASTLSKKGQTHLSIFLKQLRKAAGSMSCWFNIISASCLGAFSRRAATYTHAR